MGPGVYTEFNVCVYDYICILFQVDKGYGLETTYQKNWFCTSKQRMKMFLDSDGHMMQPI